MAPRVQQHPGTRPTEGVKTVDTTILRRDRPEVRVPTNEAPHGCYDGWVYLGSEGEDLDGEHVEEIERVRCRRCRAAGGTL